MTCTFTSNFEKELNRFFEWARNHYIIEDDSNEHLNWNKSVLPDYIETPRKKLDGFVKNVFKIYIIKDIHTNEMIDSFTEILDNFRNKKETLKEIGKTTKNKTNISNTQELNDFYSSSETRSDESRLDDHRLSINDFNDTQPFCEDDNLYFDNSLDTSKTWWLYSLSCTTDELINKYGNPIFTGKENDRHRYEWKFTYKGGMYSIYDWKDEHNKFEEFNECEWFLCGNDDMYVKEIVKLICL
jgi:hypothetical protein